MYVITHVSIVSIPSTATIMDYDAVDTILMFDSCQRSSCTNISITNDGMLENTELFRLTLDRTPDLESTIELNPVDGEVEITDNEGAYKMNISMC